MKFRKVILIMLLIIVVMFVMTTCVQTFIGDSSLPGPSTSFGKRGNEMSIKGAFIVLSGLLAIFIPRKYMTFGERWKYKGPVEPSEASVAVTRLMGGVFVLLGIASMVFY